MIAPAVVNEQEIDVDRFREQDGRTLSGVEARERIVRRNRDRQRENFEPSGRALHPASHGEWCGGVREGETLGWHSCYIISVDNSLVWRIRCFH